MAMLISQNQKGLGISAVSRIATHDTVLGSCQSTRYNSQQGLFGKIIQKNALFNKNRLEKQQWEH